MKIDKFFRMRSEEVLQTNPTFGITHDGFSYVRYITTNQGEYKENELGEIFKFNKGVLEDDQERWELVNG